VRCTTIQDGERGDRLPAQLWLLAPVTVRRLASFQCRQSGVSGQRMAGFMPSSRVYRAPKGAREGMLWGVLARQANESPHAPTSF
jgi:hypothetical protein